MKIKYFQTGLVLLYIMLSCSIIKWMLFLCGLHLSQGLGTVIMIAWGSICFSSVHFQTGLLPLGTMNIRKPVLCEEEKLQKHLLDVMRGTGCDKPFHVLIEEELGLDAFATGNNTIVISRGMLDQFSEGEIKAVLAHELGHLISKDCMVYCAFMTAGKLPQLFSFISRKLMGTKIIWMIFSKIPFITIAFIIIFLCAAFVLQVHLHLAAALTFIVCVKLFWILEPAFVFLWLIVSRYTEYKQDEFAHSLGYGKELRQALYKLTKDAVQPVNLFHVIVNGTHPIIYNRIRRLEKLEGLR